MASKGTFSYKYKTTLTFDLNSSFNITPKFLITFKLLIFIFFFLLVVDFHFTHQENISNLEGGSKMGCHCCHVIGLVI
jgi:hypothetical protein